MVKFFRKLGTKWRRSRRGWKSNSRRYSSFLGMEHLEDRRVLSILVNDTRDLLDADPLDGVIDVDLMMAGNQVSLRAAVIAGNAGGANETTLILNPGVYRLTRAGSENDTRNDLDITGDLTIVGAGAGLSVIDASMLGGGTNGRVFDIGSGGSLNLSRATVTGGDTDPGRQRRANSRRSDRDWKSGLGRRRYSRRRRLGADDHRMRVYR
jgi:hypothetical protein